MAGDILKLLLIDNSNQKDHWLYESLKSSPYVLETVKDPEEGLKKLISTPDPYMCAIIGRKISSMSSLNLLHKINTCSSLKIMPIIMEIDLETSEEIEKYIRAGARYHLPKETKPDLVLNIIEAANRDRTRYAEAASSLHSNDEHIVTSVLMYSEFKFKSLESAHSLANFLAEACPNPRLAAVGISELFINAIEHGNLGITYAEKSNLHSADKWLEEVEYRTKLPKNQNKHVTVEYKRCKTEIRIKIIDEGDGFDWKDFQEIDPTRVSDNHGRGIVMAKTLTFERLEYFGKGNEVECSIPLINENAPELQSNFVYGAIRQHS